MIVSNGEEIADSATGVRQGDPLGPLFFCLGIHQIMKKISDKFPQHVILSYMDDITILGNSNQLTDIVKEFEKAFKGVG